MQAVEDETKTVDIHFNDANVGDNHVVTGLRNVVNGEASINTVKGALPSIIFIPDLRFYVGADH